MRRSATIFFLALALAGAVRGASLVDPSFQTGAGANQIVEQVLELPNGQVMICGIFTRYNGVARNHIARLNSDGSLDETYQAVPNAWTRHMALQPDGKLVICGFFTAVNGVRRNLIARLNPDGSLDTTFDPGRGFEGGLAADINGNTDPDVMWVELQPDGKILAAGDFRLYNGVSSSGFVRINPDGSRDNAFRLGAGLNLWGRFINVLPDGMILLAGWFTTYNGMPFNRIVKLFPDGSPDHSFNAYYGDKTAVYAAVQLPDGKIITAGHSLNTTFTRGVVRLNPDGSIDPTWVGRTNEKTESILLQKDGKTIMGGYFDTVNGTSHHSKLVRFNADGSVDESFNPQANSLVWTVAPARDGKIYVSGHFDKIDGIPVVRVARLILPESLSTAPRDLVVTAADATRVYGATNPVFTGTLTGVQNGDNITATFSTSANTNSPVGSYAIVPTLNDPDGKLTNYTVHATNGTLTVTACPLSLVALNATRSYGETNPVFSGTLSGLQNGDNITASYATTADTNSPAGTYNIVGSLVDPDGKLDNYNVSITNGALTVTPCRLTVTAADAIRLYGETNPVFAGALSGVQNDDHITAKYAATADTNSPVGAYAIVPTLLDPDGKLVNYSVAATNGTLTIARRDLSVTAANATRLRGAPNPIFGGTLTGVQNNDNITATYTSSADVDSPVGSYAIVPGLNDPENKLSNYTVHATNGVLTITLPPAPTISDARIVDNQFQCTVQSTPNFIFTLQYKENAADATWISLSSLPGTGSSISLSDSNVSGTRFYRVEVR